MPRKRQLEITEAEPEENLRPGDSKPEVGPASFRANGQERGERIAKERLSFTLTPDGGIDWDSLRTQNKSKVESLLAREFERKRDQLALDEGKPLIAFNRDDIPILYDTFAAAMRSILGMVKWPRQLPANESEFLRSLIQYSDAQKERLKEPTAKMIEQYGPLWLMKHQTVVAWAMCFGTCTQEMMVNAIKQYATLKASQSKTPAPEPSPERTQ